MLTSLLVQLLPPARALPALKPVLGCTFPATDHISGAPRGLGTNVAHLSEAPILPDFLVRGIVLIKHLGTYFIIDARCM